MKYVWLQFLDDYPQARKMALEVVLKAFYHYTNGEKDTCRELMAAGEGTEGT